MLKRLVYMFGDSSRPCLTIPMLMTVLAELRLPVCPLFALVTQPVSLKFCRGRLIVSLPICFHDLHSLLHSIFPSIHSVGNSVLRW